MQWKEGLTKEHTPPPPHLKTDDDWCGEIELACRGNDSLGYDVTAHNPAKDVHQDGVHLNRYRISFSFLRSGELYKGSFEAEIQ